MLDQHFNVNDVNIKSTSLNQKETLENQANDISNLIKKKEDHIVSLYEDKLNDVITLEQYKKFETKFNQDIDDLKNQLATTQEQLNTINNQIKNKEGFNNILQKYSHITELTREITMEFINVVYIGELKDGQRDITIKWNF